MSELEALTERVRMLERRSRRLKNVGIMLIVSVIGSFALAQQRQAQAARVQGIPEVIEAKKFVLKDENGLERAVLRYDSEGSVLSLYAPDRNAQSFPAASLSAVIDKDRSKSYLTVDDVAADDIRSFKGTVTAQKFIVKDTDDITRAVLGSSAVKMSTGAVTTLPASSLVLFDEEGRVLFRAPQ